MGNFFMKPDYNRVEDYSKAYSSQDRPFDSADEDLVLQEMKSILEFSPAGIGVVKERVLGWTNNVLCTMLGYEPGTLKGKTQEFFTGISKSTTGSGSSCIPNWTDAVSALLKRSWREKMEQCLTAGSGHQDAAKKICPKE